MIYSGMMIIQNSFLPCSLSCLRLLSTGQADFAILEPEDLSILDPDDPGAARWIQNSDIVVTHELKMNLESMKFHVINPKLHSYHAIYHAILKINMTFQTEYNTEMIVLIRNHDDPNWNSKDKKLCYIGLDTTRKKLYHYHYTTVGNAYYCNRYHQFFHVIS